MKINYEKTYESLIYIILFVLSLKYWGVYFSIAIVLTFLVMLIYLSQPNRYHFNNKVVPIYILVLCIMMLIQFFRSRIVQPYMTLDYIFNEYGGCLLLPLAFPIYQILRKNKNQFLKNINKIGCTALGLKSLSWLLFNFFHINFGYYQLGGRVGFSRYFGNLLFYRISGTFLDGFLFTYTCYLIFRKETNNRKRLVAILELAFLVFFAVVVYQSRSEIIFFLGTFLVMLIYTVNKKENKYLSMFFTLIFLTILVILFKEKILNFMDTFSINSENGISTLVRQYEYSYFSQLWKKSNIWLGFGFFLDSGVFINANITLWLSDMGILLQLYQFGILGFIISIIPFGYGIILCFRILIKKGVTFLSIFVGFTAYYLLSLISFNPYLYVLYPLLPLYLGMQLYISYFIRYSDKYNII